MDREIVLHEFTLKATLDTLLVIRDKGKIDFAPAEAEKLTGLLSITLSLGPGAAGQPHVTDPPFRVIFFEKGERLLVIRRGYEPGQGLALSITEVDHLVEGIQALLNMYLDGRTHRAGPLPGANPISEVPEPPIDGLA